MVPANAAEPASWTMVQVGEVSTCFGFI